MDKGYPLILVFYLDSELMKNPDVIKPFSESVNHAIAIREANAIAFFIPTTGDERIECVSHTNIKGCDNNEVVKIVSDLKENFLK